MELTKDNSDNRLCCETWGEVHYSLIMTHALFKLGQCISQPLLHHVPKWKTVYIIICAQDVVNLISRECIWHPARYGALRKIKGNQISALLPGPLCTDLSEQAFSTKEKSLWSSSCRDLNASSWFTHHSKYFHWHLICRAPVLLIKVSSNSSSRD